MSGNDRISFRTARQEAGMTQEAAAEASGVSIESWRAYEYGDRLPPQATMARICEALEANWLGIEYLREADEALVILPELTARELPLAVVTLVNRVLHFNERCRARQLLAIAEDGIIDEAERDDYEEIVADLDGIVDAALAVKWPKGQKKTASMREHRSGSVRGRKTENDCMNYYSTSARKSKSQILQGGGVSL